MKLENQNQRGKKNTKSHGTEIAPEEDVVFPSPQMLTSPINHSSLPVARPVPIAAQSPVLPQTVPLPLGGPRHGREDDAGRLPPGLAGRGQAAGQGYTEDRGQRTGQRTDSHDREE